MKAMLVGVMLTAATTTTLAGGILTNTNQSIDFLRNPSRDAAIGLDGVYSNPAGVAFMPEGLASTGSMPTRHVPSLPIVLHSH